MTQAQIDALNSLRTHEEIHEAWVFLKHRSTELDRQKANSLRIGQAVTWRSKRHIEPKRGTVLAVNRTTVTVNVNGIKWRVSASLLQPDNG